MKKLYLLSSIVILTLILLTACSGTPATTAKPSISTTASVTSAAPTTTSVPPSVTVKAAATAVTPPASAQAPSVTPQPSGISGQQVYGGTLKVIVPTGLVNLGNPSETGSPTDLFAVGPAVETLLHVDEKGNIVPWLATGWQIAPDNKSITLVLRKGVKFHDGTDFNAAAVKYLLDAVRTSNVPDLKPVTSVDIVDDYTVRLNFVVVQTQILNFLAANRTGWMISPTYLKNNPPDTTRLNPVGTGPFKFVSFQRDVSLKYIKFNDYWQKGKPYLDAIEEIQVEDLTTAILAFKSGAAQSTIQISTKDAAAMRDSREANIGMAPAGVYVLAGDSKNPDSPFAKLEVRQAMTYAIDSVSINRALGYGITYATNQFFPDRMWGYNPNIVGYPYNQAKARELLKQAGYPNGFKTSLIYQIGFEPAWFGAWQSALAQVGINAELQPVTGSLATQYNTQGWKGILFSVVPGSLGTDPPYGTISSLGSKASRLTSVVAPKEFDDALALASAETDFNKKKELFKQVVSLAIDKYCMITPAYGTPLLSANTFNLRDAKIREIWSMQWAPADAWLSK